MALRADLITLGMQFSHLLRRPARAGAPIGDLLAEYASLVEDLILTDAPDHAPEAEAVNAFRALDLLIANCVLAVVEAVTRFEFATRPQALGAAESLRTLYERYYAWREARYAALGLVDPGVSYQEVQRAVAQTTAYLVEISFSLKQEHRIVLDRARTALDICAEFYGEVDPMLDFFIESNALTGLELVEIPKGRTVVLYL